MPGLLVEPDWLQAHLPDTRLQVVDLRDPDAYHEGHIPGASHLHLSDLGFSHDGRDNVLVSAREFARLMSARGISHRDLVVAYDDQWGLAAARLVWALHRYGHSEVAVLNGGWDRWKDEGRPTESGETSGEGADGAEGGKDPPGSSRGLPFVASPRADVHADTDWIANRIEAGDAVLVDSRTQAEFEQGHIPGARSWDWFNAVPTGSWNALRDLDELRDEWRELGLDPSDEVTVYCRSGMRAAHTYLALRHAGFSRVRLYDGSWQEWSTIMEGEGDG